MNKYNKKLKLRKNKLIKYIKKDYCEYEGETPFIYINKIILENYLEYYSLADNVMQSDKSRLKIVQQIKDALVIADRLIADTYEAEANAWRDEHSKTNGTLNNSCGVHGLYCYSCEWDTDDNYTTWKQLSIKAEKARTKDLKALFRYIANHCSAWWD